MHVQLENSKYAGRLRGSYNVQNIDINQDAAKRAMGEEEGKIDKCIKTLEDENESLRALSRSLMDEKDVSIMFVCVYIHAYIYIYMHDNVDCEP